jgi:nucleoside-triphosphatase THEP1
LKGWAATGLAAVALLAALLPFPGAPVLGLILAVLVVLLVEPRALRHSFGLRTLVLVVLGTSLTTVAVAWSAGTPRGVAVGGATLLRLLVLALVATVASRHVDAESLQRAASRLRLPRLGLVFGLSLNSLPHLAEAWRDAWIALAMRSRRRRPRLRALPLLAETLLAHAGRVAEEAAAAAALRGHPALTQPLVGATRVPLLVPVTGRSGTGKTPVIQRSVELLQRRGIEVFGFVQPSVTEGGEKAGFRILDVRTGRETMLARRVGREQGQHNTPFAFERTGFALASQALAEGTRGSVLVVDEIGPVELRGGGHWPAVRRALARLAPAVVVLGVRRQLVAAFLAQLEAEAVIVVDVEASTNPVDEVLAAVGAAMPGVRP